MKYNEEQLKYAFIYLWKTKDIITQWEDTEWTISGIKKEELIVHVKQSLKSL